MLSFIEVILFYAIAARGPACDWVIKASARRRNGTTEKRKRKFIQS